MQDPILIVGMGKSGLAALRLLTLLGYSREKLKTFDNRSGVADFHMPEQISSFNPKSMVISPGVPLSTPWIQNLIQSGVHLTSELDLALQNCTTEKIIGVTGSMGKSTTTSLLGEGVRSFSPNSFVGGNLGIPFADYVVNVMEQKAARAEWVILELSSYQLENAASLKTSASVLTALSPNHLERYPNLDAYYDTKWTLLNKTQGLFFLNFANPEVARWCSDKMTPSCIKVHTKDFDLKGSKLIGAHNEQNLALAMAVARHFKWPGSAFEAMRSYRGLEHRIEFVAEKNGVVFINDSKATTIESVLAAVDSCQSRLAERGRLHLLLGGRDKNLPWEELTKLRENPNLVFHFFGEYGPEAQKKSKLLGNSSDKLSIALNTASSQIGPGDVVLLSPGGSSLDEFKSFEERGDFFKNWVKSLS